MNADQIQAISPSPSQPTSPTNNAAALSSASAMSPTNFQLSPSESTGEWISSPNASAVPDTRASPRHFEDDLKSRDGSDQGWMESDQSDLIRRASSKTHVERVGGHTDVGQPLATPAVGPTDSVVGLSDDRGVVVGTDSSSCGCVENDADILGVVDVVPEAREEKDAVDISDVGDLLRQQAAVSQIVLKRSDESVEVRSLVEGTALPSRLLVKSDDAAPGAPRRKGGDKRFSEDSACTFAAPGYADRLVSGMFKSQPVTLRELHVSCLHPEFMSCHRLRLDIGGCQE